MATKTATSRKFEERREQAAKTLGLDADSIGSVRIQLRQIRSLGILVDIDVRGTSMFQRAASWAEWGIADQDIRHSRLSGGVKLLIPALYVKRLRSLETRFRQTLETYSYNELKAFAPYRWIPFTAYKEWRAEWDRLQADLDGIKADILKNYDRFVDDLAGEFYKIGQGAWKDFSAHGYSAVKVGGKEYATEVEYARFVSDRAVSQMPTRQQIKDGLLVDYRTALVSDEADLEAELLAADRTSAARERIRADAQRDAKAEAVADQETRIRIAAMRQAEIEHARQRLQEMGSPLDEVVNALRGRILRSAQAMLESVQKSGFVRGKIAEQGAGLLEFFDLMSVGNDETLRNRLYELKSAIGPIGKERTKDTEDRNADAVRATLEQIISIAETEALNVGISNRFASLEL
jgi:hypothetical protein